MVFLLAFATECSNKKGVTQEELSSASRDELIELAIIAMRRADEECDRRTQSETRLAEVEQQLRWFKNQLFGTKSERRPMAFDDSSQLHLGEIAKTGSAEEESSVATVRAHPRRKKTRTPGEDLGEGETGLRFDDSVPVKTIHVPNPEIDDLPEDQREHVTEKISYRLAQEPASYVVLKIVRPVMKREDTGEFVCPPAPASVLPGSYTDVSVLAGLLIDKFRYHIPLYRQHQRMRAAGLTISRSSLSNWVHRSVDLLEPIYQSQLGSILQSQVLAMDETPIRAGRKSKGKMRTAYFWPIYGDRDEVAFPYASSRAHEHARTILGAYCGTLISDGYQAYDDYAARRDEVVHAQCWVHVRRGFVKAENVEPARCAEAIGRIAELYRIEKEIREKKLEGEAKQEVRGEKSKTLVAEFFKWLKDELVAGALLPKDPFTKAANYALKRKQALEVFLADPDVPMDTNHLERALRVIPMGRKNWLFCWTEIGAEKVGQIQSLIATCVLHDVDPYAYLVDVLQRIDSHPQSRVSELTPRLWKEKFAEAPLRSMLSRTLA
jgi:transposase